MAYTKIHAIKSTLVKALDYIENPEKTEDQLLVSGYNVDPLTASMEFTMTRVMAKNMIGERGGKGPENLAYHLIQSFSPQDNVTPEQAHELGRRLANELLEGKYEYVISTHVDKGHTHNHIIFNATSFYTFRKFRTQPFKTASKIRTISDRICAEADLSVIRTPQELGRTYQYKTAKYGMSWKRQIRRRLQFVLQVADSFDEFLEGAARLGVTVDTSGKYVTYKMEGQERVTRDRTLDKEGAFSVEGIEAQIEANTQAREHLKEAIRESAVQSTDYKGFQAGLKRRGVETARTKRSGLRYTVDEEIVLWGWTLGPDCSEEAIQAVIYGTEPPPAEPGDILDRLELEFRKTGQNSANEVGVHISRNQVMKSTADGLLISVPNERAGTEQLVFIDRNHVTYHRDTDSFTVHIGNGYDYNVAAADGSSAGGRMRGEDVIRALELENDVQPRYIEIVPADIKALSSKGLTIAIPELGIDGLFIPDRFVAYDRMEGGTVQAAFYENWSYRFQAPDGSVKYLSGIDLAKHLEPRQTAAEGSLLGRLNALRRRNMVAETKRLAKALMLARQEGIQDMAGFELRLAELRDRQASVRSSIQGLQVRNTAYRAVARHLVTYHTYLPVKLESMKLSGKALKSYEYTHEAELSAWGFAKEQLEKGGVRTEVDPEKVLELVKEQERELAELKTQAGKLAEQTVALETAQKELQRAQTEEPQQDRTGRQKERER